MNVDPEIQYGKAYVQEMKRLWFLIQTYDLPEALRFANQTACIYHTALTYNPDKPHHATLPQYRYSFMASIDACEDFITKWELK